MKLARSENLDFDVGPAAFRRLCVETTAKAVLPILGLPAAFRRLCVETLTVAHIV